jgi:hypothetical protein
MTGSGSNASAKRRRSRALPGVRLTAEMQQLTVPTPGRLQKRLERASDLKEGAHGGTRGSPVLSR